MGAVIVRSPLTGYHVALFKRLTQIRRPFLKRPPWLPVVTLYYHGNSHGKGRGTHGNAPPPRQNISKHICIFFFKCSEFFGDNGKNTPSINFLSKIRVLKIITFSLPPGGPRHAWFSDSPEELSDCSPDSPDQDPP